MFYLISIVELCQIKWYFNQGPILKLSFHLHHKAISALVDLL